MGATMRNRRRLLAQSPVKAEAIDPTSCHILLWTNFLERERHPFRSRVETLVNVLQPRWSLKCSQGLSSRVPTALFHHFCPPISDTASRGCAGTIGFEKHFADLPTHGHLFIHIQHEQCSTDIHHVLILCHTRAMVVFIDVSVLTHTPVTGYKLNVKRQTSILFWGKLGPRFDSRLISSEISPPCTTPTYWLPLSCGMETRSLRYCVSAGGIPLREKGG